MKTQQRDAEVREFWFESHGTRLFAVERGSGVPVVLLHGAMGDHSAVVGMCDPLPENVRLIAPDVRGVELDPGSFWDQLAGDVVSLLDHLGIERAIVGGVSSGATIAVRFALHYPRRTAGLIVVTPVHGPGPLTESQQHAFAMMDALAQRALQEGFEVFVPMYERLPPEVRVRALEILRTLDPTGVATTTNVLARGPRPLAGTALGEVRARALLVPGGDDLHPAAVSAAYARELRRCSVSGALDAAALGRFADRCFAEGQVHLILGPVGAGKSTYALALCRDTKAIRFTLDEWMVHLFRPDRPDSGVAEWYVERARRCVELIWKLALRTIETGTSVVLELGLIRREDRARMWEELDAAGCELTVHVLDAPREVRRARVLARNEAPGETFSMVVPPEIFELASDLWEPLDETEQRGRDVRFLTA